jgi:hypothetical protein
MHLHTHLHDSTPEKEKIANRKKDQKDTGMWISGKISPL